MSDNANLHEAIGEHIAEVLRVLSSVTEGNYSGRLETDLPEGHPIRELYAGVNETISSLAEADERAAAYQRELESKLETIERQRAAIRELSTPVIELWDGVLCLPVVGVMDTGRSTEMTDSLLVAVVERQARCAIIDITGIELMDTSTAAHFMKMAKAVRLLGTECVLTGISPAIAQTIVQMGIDLAGIKTQRSLRDALKEWIYTQVIRTRQRLAAEEARKERREDHRDRSPKSEGEAHRGARADAEAEAGAPPQETGSET